MDPGIRIAYTAAPWSKRDRAAFKMPPKLKPSEWQERYRYLDHGALPGPWRNDNAPYLVGMMDLCVAPGVERMIWMKAAQVGASQATRGLMGYWAHQDPAPMGLALPDKEKGRSIIENEVLPFFRREFGRHVDLRELLSARLHDMKKGQIKLANAFILYLMWAGSETSMAADPMKRAIADEANKFPAWAGDDADPISLIEKRQRTYPDRLLLVPSTPTTQAGIISGLFESCHVKLYFLVPCRVCGARQRLIFGQGVPGEGGVFFSKEVQALRKEKKLEQAGLLVLQEGQAWYECCDCGAHWDEKMKRQAVRAGKWGTVAEDGIRSDGGEVLSLESRGSQVSGLEPHNYSSGPIADAQAITRWPRGMWIGMHISSLYCCWENWTLAHIAKEFIEARTLAARFAFTTSTLGETWKETASAAVKIEVMDERVKEATLAEGIVPRWAARLIATVDTQKDHFWLIVRAWGPGLKSARVFHSRIGSFEELELVTLRRAWVNEDPALPPRTCDKVFIDSGAGRSAFADLEPAVLMPSRVMEVYAWCLKFSSMVQAIKGDARPELAHYIRNGTGEYVTDREKKPVPLKLLDVHHFQDQLAELMTERMPLVNWTTGEVYSTAEGADKTEARWQLNTRHDPEYHAHLTAMHKITDLKRARGTAAVGGGRTGGGRWVPKREGMRVDYRAIEGYQVAAAFMTGVHLLPDMPIYLAGMEAQRKALLEARQMPPAAGGMRTPDGRAFVATQRET